MKHFTIKPLLIAAAIAATGALSVVTANAATDGAVMDGIVKTFSTIINGEEVEVTITEYAVDDGEATEVELELPDGEVGDGVVIVVENDDGTMKILSGNAELAPCGEANVAYDMNV